MMNPAPPPTSVSSAATGGAGMPLAEREKIYQWIVELTSPETRENALQELRYNTSHHARRQIFGVSEQVLHKPTCTITEDCYKLEILDIMIREIVLSVEQLLLPLFSHRQIFGFLMAHS